MSFKNFLLPVVALGFFACNVSDPHEHNEEELITTVRLVYTDTANASNADTVVFRDADGPGGAAPTAHDTLRLAAGKTYRVSLSLLNESDPLDVEDITTEVEEEGVDHQVFYAASGVNLTMVYADQDANGLPLGLRTLQTAGAASSGTLTVTLKHQPGLKTAGGTVSTGETDVEIAFQAVIQ
jgi:hypothetical protein